MVQGLSNELVMREKKIRKRILSLQALKRKQEVLRLARTGARSLAIQGDEWDRDPWLLGVENGVIDLRTGELRSGKPADYIRTVARTSFLGLYYPAPTWERALSEIFSDNPEVTPYIQKLLGYGITGLTNLHMILIFYGPSGRNGKGTVIEALKIVLGDLAHKTRTAALLQSRYPSARGAADADTVAFQGKRIIWASETDDGQSLDAARIKELTGGDTLNARLPYAKRAVEFAPSHLLILLTNHRPKVPADDEALWSRLHLIPFNQRFVDDPVKPNERRADHALMEKLKQEVPGILAWLVRGCLAWQKEDLCQPDCVKVSIDEYRSAEDELVQFLEDEGILKSGPSEIRTSFLHADYVRWFHDTQSPGNPMSMKRFSSRLVGLGYERDATGRHPVFRFKVAEQGVIV